MWKWPKLALGKKKLSTDENRNKLGLSVIIMPRKKYDFSIKIHTMENGRTVFLSVNHMDYRPWWFENCWLKSNHCWNDQKKLENWFNNLNWNSASKAHSKFPEQKIYPEQKQHIFITITQFITCVEFLLN